MDIAKSWALIKYGMMVIILQIACEALSYCCQLMYHSICCSDFKTYYIMHTSNTCQALRQMEYLSPKRIISHVTDLKA